MKIQSLLFTFSFCCLFVFKSQAQDQVGAFLQAGATDANILAKAYVSPLGKAFGADLNTGWLTTGKVFKPGRFEVRVFGTAAFIPDNEKTFDVSALGLSQNVKVGAGYSPVAPTIFGPNTDGPQLDVSVADPSGSDPNKRIQLGSFKTPPGAINYKVAPLPMAQLNVGLLKNTELMVRYLPEVTYDKAKVRLKGIGLKHSISQWLPVVRALPVDITASVAYTKFRSSYGLDVQPQMAPNGQDVRTAEQRAPSYYDNQELQFNTDAFNASLVVSKTITVLTGFAGLTYSTSKTNIATAGMYPILQVQRSGNTNQYSIYDYTMPVNFDMNQKQLGLTGGIRIKLALLSLFAQGTLAKYNTVTAGVGLGWN